MPEDRHLEKPLSLRLGPERLPAEQAAERAGLSIRQWILAVLHERLQQDAPQQPAPRPRLNGRPAPEWAPLAAGRYRDGESVNDLVAAYDSTPTEVLRALRSEQVTIRTPSEAAKVKAARRRTEATAG